MARADGHGYPVQRGWTGDAVRIFVPRCDECRRRNICESISTLAGAACGAAIGLAIQASWLSFCLGLWLGAWLVSLPVLFCRNAAGLRSVKKYPPLVRLRDAGWCEPD